MHILWINEHASLLGGCESYIYHTVKLLKEHNVSSTLLYNPTNRVEESFLKPFDAAFPLVDLQKQLQEIPHDLIYIHQLIDEHSYSILGEAEKPTLRFLHDHQLFCLRGSKLPFFSNTACGKTADCCYSLGFTLIGNSKKPLGMELKTLSQLHHQQNLNQGLDGVIVASHYMLQEATKVGFSPSKVFVIPLYALNPNLNTLQKRESHLLLYVGQFLRGKGVDVLLHALALLQEPYHLLLAGKGKNENSYRKLIRELHLENRVTFLGHMNDQELANYYQKASCLVLPIRAPESFGLVGPEAMSYGLPVITSPLGGVTEWFENDRTGISVKPNDPVGLSKAILSLCEQPEKLALISAEAKNQYEAKFTSAPHIKNLIALFESEINRKKSIQKQPKRFTAFGSPLLEQQIQEMLQEIAQAVEKDLPKNSYRALLLIGGYGKGDGGVEILEGQERAHNNFDFVLITKEESEQHDLEEKVQACLSPISKKQNIEFDLSSISERKLRNSRALLIWYELYHAHFLIAGDPSFVASLPFKDLQNVPAIEFLELMVNRGSLLIINQWLLHSQPKFVAENPQIIIKHIMKAIIGFGDALLYFLGDYHWSYQTKKTTIQNQNIISERFRKLYEEASSFRLTALYKLYLNRDFLSWMKEIDEVLADVFLQCESIRMQNSQLNWKNYLSNFLAFSLTEKNSFRERLKKIWWLFHPPKYALGNSWREKLLFCSLSPRQRLSSIFPFIAFELGDKTQNEAVARFLDAQNCQLAELQRAYLYQWSTHGDKNFPKLLQEWKLSLSTEKKETI